MIRPLLLLLTFALSGLFAGPTTAQDLQRLDTPAADNDSQISELSVTYVAFDEPKEYVIEAFADAGPFSGYVRSDVAAFLIYSAIQAFAGRFFNMTGRVDNTSTAGGGPVDVMNLRTILTRVSGPGFSNVSALSPIPFSTSCEFISDGISCLTPSQPAGSTWDWPFQTFTDTPGDHVWKYSISHPDFDPDNTNNDVEVTITFGSSTGSVFGTKFESLLGNNEFNLNDPPVADWPFYVDLDLDGNFDENEPSTTTNASGMFNFSSLSAGSARITERFTSETSPVWGPAGGTTFRDVVIVAGGSVTDIDFFNFQYPTYGGRVYTECDFDSTFDGGTCELPLPGISVTITPPSGPTVVQMTDANGMFTHTGSEVQTEIIALDLTSVSPTQLVANPSPASYTSTPSSGQMFENLDSGLYVPGTMTGTKYDDRNGNGMKEGGEPGLQGWEISYSGTSGNVSVSGTATTGSDGTYSIDNLVPATYTVEETAQSGWTASTSASRSVEVSAGQDVTDIDFGNYQPPEIFGRKWRDDSGDGVLDSGEVFLPDWTISITGPNSFSSSTTTDSNGGYSFSGLVPGTFTVSEVNQSGWTQTSPSGGGAFEILVESGDSISQRDFGNQPPTNGELHGQKFLDFDGDGEKDDSEPGLNGVSISLSLGSSSVATQVTHSMDLNEDGSIDALTEMGLFWFQDLGAGSYVLTEGEVPGTTQTAPSGGQFEVALSPGQIVNNLLFANKPNLGALDWGDLPDQRADLVDPCPFVGSCYETLNASIGPSHLIIPQPFVLGEIIDAEVDGQPDVLALGDDENDTPAPIDYRSSPTSTFDDEDGLVSVSLQPDGSLEFVVRATDPLGTRTMLLDVWVDLNDDGFLADRRDGTSLLSEDVIIAAPLVTGLNTVNTGVLNPPLQPGEAIGHIRMRLSSLGSLDPFGPAIDGEVEDYRDVLLDFGDAPPNMDPDHPDIPFGYATNRAQNGARHAAVLTIRIGGQLDAETDGQASIFADGDDNSSVPDDEDGITFDDGFESLFLALDGDPNELTYVPGMVPGVASKLVVYPSIIGDLDAWFDWNRDGDWDDDGEWVIEGQDVHPASDTLTITIPAGANLGFTFSRFRFTANGTNGPSGFAPQGEVEDYLMKTIAATPVGSTDDTGDANPGDGICDDGTGQCTLRAAIEEANAIGEPTILTFASFGKQEVIFTPQSPLPAFTAPIILEGGNELVIDGSQAGADAHGIQIQANGSSILGTRITNFSGDGVRIEGSNNRVMQGGSTDNAGAGIRVVSGTGNTIRLGSYSGNGQLAIDLGDTGDGVSANDAGDSDTGANNLQNFPVLSVVTAENGHIEGTLSSSASASFDVDLYSSTACDASGNGQGALYLGSISVTTDALGSGSFSADVSVLSIGDAVTSTATDSGGNTSEFSTCFVAVTTSIERVPEAEVPNDYVLYQNYPNPFNPVTSIQFAISSREFVTIEVFDVVGKKVATLVNGWVEPGRFTVTLDASGLPSGTYLYNMRAGHFRSSKQFTLLK